MKFFTSNNWFLGRPKPWLDYNLNETETIKKYFYDKVKVWDADICGDEKIDFVFENGKAYRMEYSWWIEYNPDWDLCEEYSVNEISIDEAENCMKIYRDIIKV